MEDLITDIRNLIQTPDAKYIYPNKYYDTNLYKGEFINIYRWNSPTLFVRDVLDILQRKKGLGFESFEAFRDWVLTPGTLESVNKPILDKLYNELQSVQTSSYTEEELAEIRALLDYENIPWFRGEPVLNYNGEPLNTVSVETRIRRLLSKQKPVMEEVIVWRGQNGKEILPLSWFSVSLEKEVADSYGSDLFKINIQPGVRMFDLYKEYAKYGIQNPLLSKAKVRSIMRNMYFMGHYSSNYSEYKENIVEGGGTFYKDISKREPGFTFNGEYFETYYFPPESAQSEIQWNRNMYPVKSNRYKRTIRRNNTIKNAQKFRNSTRTKKNIQYPSNMFNYYNEQRKYLKSQTK